jgi:hypothetical protein
VFPANERFGAAQNRLVPAHVELWLIKYDNAVKVLNGNYANDRTVEDERESETFNSFDEDEFITAAMQRGFAI